MYQVLSIKGKNRLLLIIIFLIILGLWMVGAGLAGQQVNVPQATTSATPVLEDEEVKVKNVIDGDTIELNTGQKVRYIGVDTPETVDPRRPVACFGKEAGEENKKLVQGKTILLEKDISEVDKYGRLLRYVYLKLDDGSTLFVNDHLVRQGFAQVSTHPPDVKFTKQLVSAEKEARESSRGLWQKCSKINK